MDAALRGKVFLSPFILAVRNMNYASSVFPTAKTPPAARNTRLPGGEFAGGGGQEIGLELFSPKQVSVAPVSSSSLEEVIRAAKKACKGQAGSDPVPSVSQERQLTAHDNPLSGRDHQFCNGSEMHASDCLPAAGSMPGGMTGENPFATVVANKGLRENQRQAAALAAVVFLHLIKAILDPLEIWHRLLCQWLPIRALWLLPSRLSWRPAASASQHADLQQQIQLAEMTLSMTVGIRQRERRPVSTRTSQWLKRYHQPMHSEDPRSVHATGVFKEGQHTPAQAIRSH